MSNLTDPRLWTIVLILTGLGVMVMIAVYEAGKKSKTRMTGEGIRVSRERMEQAERAFDRFGVWSLWLTFIPGVASALSFAAGNLGVRLLVFIAIVGTVKLIRNWLLVIVIITGGAYIESQF